MTDNKEIHNYEMIVDGHRSFIDYEEKDNKIYLLHTETAKPLEGKGVAGELLGQALEDIESRGLKMVPRCSYVKYFLKKHPEWNRIVAE